MCARAKVCVTLCTCTCYMIKLPVQLHKTPDFNFYLVAQGKTCLFAFHKLPKNIFGKVIKCKQTCFPSSR